MDSSEADLSEAGWSEADPSEADSSAEGWSEADPSEADSSAVGWSEADPSAVGWSEADSSESNWTAASRLYSMCYSHFRRLPGKKPPRKDLSFPLLSLLLNSSQKLPQGQPLQVYSTK